MELHELHNGAIDQIIEGMNTDKLSPWELKFFESISDQWERTRDLSDKQKQVLGTIWDKQ